MKKHLLGIGTLAAVATLTLAGCGGSGSDAQPAASGGSSAAVTGKIGVILPDTESSARWENADRPFFTKAFGDAGVQADIQNAQGDATQFQTIADGMISAGVKALIITSLDPDSGSAVIKKATDAGIPVIDYDRANLGGGAKYYVSFDNVKVGTTIGEGLVGCLKADGKTSGNVVELNGSPDDNNATLFKQGYDKVIRDAGYTVVADQAVPKWNNDTGGQLFEQIYTKQGGKIDGVAAANDGLGGAVVSVLQRNGLAGKVPVSGQDATDEGLQRILLGTQCNTVYKAVAKEADAAAKLGIALAKGDVSGADALATQTFNDPKAGADKKAILLDPQAITKDNVKAVIDDGYTTADKICTTAALKKACSSAGIS
ncbi:sugar ABC transporter substrate-binding protein [Microlunatus flavus]|uniref:D-xylose transport system substrate-binding protein n=1 Tax=Microlunatus flavus TaxID=1036181 RepID=A0A1H9AQK9_9ACTN|nr:substrate-binding domain-containing protein [Microlunatus flavus]SEP79010.1 D-xylose transport system substrate-binding protein [Microlunatus flavus]